MVVTGESRKATSPILWWIRGRRYFRLVRTCGFGGEIGPVFPRTDLFKLCQPGGRTHSHCLWFGRL